MRRLGLALLIALATAARASAHPAPFSYLDVELGERAVEVTLVAHAFDIAHELGLASPDDALDPALLARRQDDLVARLLPRFRLAADERVLSCRSSAAPEAVPDRSAVRLRFTCPSDGPAGVLRVRAALFPYDPAHQTFLNLYEGGALQSQAILDRDHDATEYFAGTRQGALAVARRFLPAGVHHILIGPDHLLFLVGLLLLGGSVRQLAWVVTAFTVAHSLTLSLAALAVFTPPARIVEPAIALSIVYVGADNLLARGGRDVRAWIALGFGLVHGFGFASVLREMELPRRALAWSLFSFNVGVEIGQLLVVLAVASALAALRARSEEAGRRLAVAGSIVVVVAGSLWFVQRLFFS
ncbi:MAG TPA: HupE/UreJ family protein [Vicinamibacteria bacterium]|nr:HupE/UreJ family protein [Vicinamibacteria bacterium]